jgi:hypothetical protein
MSHELSELIDEPLLASEKKYFIKISCRQEYIYFIAHTLFILLLS